MKLLKTLAVGVLILSMSACDAFFDVNTDPDAATDVPGGLLFPTIMATWGSNRAMEGGQYFTYFSQVFSSNAQLLNWYDAERYDVSTTAVNNLWLAYYGTIQRNAVLGTQFALDAEPMRMNEAAQFQILRALNYYEASLIWEEVPFTEAHQPDEFPEPRSDDQQTVLNGVIDMLDEAISMVDLDNPETAITTLDVLYGGDMDSWIRFANSIKLHVYMTLRGGGQNVDSEMNALINNPNLIRTASQNAYIPFDNSSKNPLGRMPEVYSAANWFWSGAPLTRIMNEWDDPRRPIYMTENNAGEYNNAPAGTGIGAAGSRTRRDTYLATDMPVSLMYAHEVLFLEAEFLASNGQLAAADAKFREGIMEAIAGMHTAPEGSSVNVNGRAAAMGAGDIPQAARQAFVDQFPDLTTLSIDDALELIWHQHYVALHGDGIQSWTLVRRVGENVFGLSLHPESLLPTFISRIPYQINETAANPNAPVTPPLQQDMWFQNNAR